jgi:hypothetical protein
MDTELFLHTVTMDIPHLFCIKHKQEFYEFRGEEALMNRICFLTRGFCRTGGRKD